MCNGTTRRRFLKNSLVGGAALGAGFDVYHKVFAAQKTNIKYTTWQVPASLDFKTVFAPMLEEMKKRSNGEITYTLYAAGALGKAPEQYDVIAKGMADMGYFVTTFTPGKFPLSDVLSLASSIEAKDISADISRPVYEHYLRNEYKDVKMHLLNGCISAYLWTRKPVLTLADMKGLRIRTPGGFQTQYTRELGAEVVFMPPGDIYMALQTGTVDGVVTCPLLMLAYRLYEVAKHGTLLTFGCVGEGVASNLNYWKNVPEGHKHIIDNVSSNPYRVTGGLTKKAYDAMMKEITDKGVTYYTLPPEEAERWYEKFRDVTRRWVMDMERRGHPAKEMVKMYNAECQKRGVKVVAFPPEWK